MFIYRAYFPYIAGQKIPLHYYSMLYQQLDMIWKDLVAFLRDNDVEYQVDKHNLEIKASDDVADSVLARLHMSFMLVDGEYHGELVDMKTYLEYLVKDYSRALSELMLDLATSIDSEDYKRAYDIAFKALEKIAQAENMYCRTGRRLTQIVFEMLHGNIPQTYTNTYLLAIKGSELVKNIAPKIYRGVAETAKSIALSLKMNVKAVEKLYSNTN